MNTGRSLPAVICLLASLLALAACYGNNNGYPSSLAVEFSIAPPASDTLGTNFQVAAVVSDGSNVNWSCTPAGSCGSFNPTQTGSNVSTTYMPPATVPAGGSVTIMAVSAEDSTKEASQNVTINPGGTVSVTFNAPAPPPTLTNSGSVQVSATINSTVANAVSDGIDWTATCTNSAGGGCGTFNPAHTTSGGGTMYSPPTTVPAGGVAVTVKAASTLDPQDSVSAVITVSTTQTSAFLCASCSYTFTFSGTETNGNPYAAAGVFTTSGTGNITGGEEDFSDPLFTTGNTPVTLMTNTGYSFGSDGRGTITLNTGNTNIGVNGVETLGVVFVSPNHLLITELDQSATASGTIDLQTVHSFSTTTLSGGFAFVFGGAFSGGPLGFGGVFNVDSAGSISGKGSTADINAAGSGATQQSLNGGFTVSDQMGRIQLTLKSGAFGSVGLTGPMILDGYITDGTHVKLVEVDANIGAVSSGFAIGQGAATGTFTSASGALPANSSYVFATFGAIPTGAVAFTTTFTSDGSSKLQNGSADVNASGVPSSGTVSGTYTVDSSGTGRVAVNLIGNTIVGNPNTYDNFAVYLTGGADAPMVLEVDQYGVTTGSLYLQSAGPFNLSSFSGSYGLNFTLFNDTDSAEVDVSGQVFADGAGNLLGTMDINDNGLPLTNQGFTGAYASAASGRFTGSITIATTPSTNLGVSYFIISPSQVIFIETDTNDVSQGLFQLQTPPF